MKTPREILLDRHRNATTRLDAIRHATVESIAGESGFPGRVWRELILAARGPWLVLSAAWLIIAWLTYSAGEPGGEHRPVPVSILQREDAASWHRQLQSELGEVEGVVITSSRRGPHSQREEKRRFI